MSIVHLERLKELMPPLEPAPDSVVDWNVARDVFGLSFPADFTEFVATYGNVIWCDLFRPIYPITKTLSDCQKSKDHVLEILGRMYKSDLLDEENRIINLPHYPAPGGIFPCLVDTNGCYICWITTGAPDNWITAKFDSGYLQVFQCDLTQLICAWIEQKPPASDIWDSTFLETDNYGLAP